MKSMLNSLFMTVFLTFIAGCSGNADVDNESANPAESTATESLTGKLVEPPQEIKFEMPQDVPVPATFLHYGSGMSDEKDYSHYRITAQAPDIVSVDAGKEFYEKELPAKGWNITDRGGKNGGAYLNFEKGNSTGNVTLYLKPEYKGVSIMMDLKIQSEE